MPMRRCKLETCYKRLVQGGSERGREFTRRLHCGPACAAADRNLLIHGVTDGLSSWSRRTAAIPNGCARSKFIERAVARIMARRG